jgi:cell division protein FtsQ
MKMGSKRGAAVLEAPEDDTPYEAEAPNRRSARGAAHERRRDERGGFRDKTRDEDFGGEDYYDEPAFRRQQSGYRLRVRRGLPKSWAGRIAFLVGVLAVIGVVWAGLAEMRSAFLHDSRFVIASSEDIQISGNEHVTRAEVLSVFGADLERNIFRVPLAERRADLERLPWVQHATVMRLLPNRLRVAVTERTPVAFVRRGSQIGLVDASGVLLDMPEDSAGDPHYSFPVLTGLSAGDPLSVRAARMGIYRQFMQALDSTGEGFSKTLSEVDVSNPEDVKAVVASGGSDILVHFGDEQFLARYKEFQRHLPEWKRQYPRLASADMRYDRQVVLEMQPGTGVPVSGGGAAAGAANATAAAADAAGTSAGTGVQPAEVTVRKFAGANAKAHRTPVLRRPKARARRIAGKASNPNGKLFAELAAEHRAELARKAKHSSAAGAR